MIAAVCGTIFGTFFDFNDREEPKLQTIESYTLIYRFIGLQENLTINGVQWCVHLPYRRDIYKPLNRTSSQIVRVAAASGLAQEF